ncbi:FAD-dependent monooxygenase [Nonomuraea sp. NPDC049141]|uniref:FAD-dependent monooxygenase n=1 Tax=Nonomuraea sp. NPDC049141 TaxID=3155500 RepID=UPI00340362B0
MSYFRGLRNHCAIAHCGRQGVASIVGNMKSVAARFSEHFDVIIVGGGPVGLMVACELALARVRVMVAERRYDTDQTIKAFGLHISTVEALRRRGLLPRVLEAQRLHTRNVLASLATRRRPLPPPDPAFANAAGHFAGLTIPRDQVEYGDPRFGGPDMPRDMLPLSQQTLERILAEHAVDLGVDLRRGAEPTGFTEDEDGVDVSLASGERLRCDWLVGADGGRSMVRRSAGFDFPGTDPEITGRQALAEFENPEVLRAGWNRTGTGFYVYTPLANRILTVEMDGPPDDRHSPITPSELQASLRRVSGTDITVASIETATRFTDNARQASTYVKGRVILAGDAAHVHSPFGGQGLNLGIGDAMNLGWKLAATVRGWAPSGLLDTYTRERHPVGAWVLDWTRAQIALMRLDPRTESLRRIMGDLLGTPDGATHMVTKLTGTSQRYDLPGDHPLVGRSAPDLDLAGGGRLDDVMRHGQAVLVGPATLASAAEGRRGRLIHAESSDGPALLVRPDGHVAWASDGDHDLKALEEGVSTWLGDPDQVEAGAHG